GLFDPEGPDLCPAQGDAVATERLRDRPHVRARADPKVETRDAVSIRDDIERVYTRPANGHLHLDPAPVQPVGALAADLDRGRGRNRQLDLAAEGREPARKLRCIGQLQTLHDLAFGIAGRSARAQIDIRDIPLVESHEA